MSEERRTTNIKIVGLLITGYIREFENKNELQYPISDDLKRLIIFFYDMGRFIFSHATISHSNTKLNITHDVTLLCYASRDKFKTVIQIGDFLQRKDELIHTITLCCYRGTIQNAIGFIY